VGVAQRTCLDEFLEEDEDEDEDGKGNGAEVEFDSVSES